MAYKGVPPSRGGAGAAEDIELISRVMFETSRDAIMLLDREHFLDCNPATLHIFGLATKEEFCSKHPADLSPPAQAKGKDSFRAAMERIDAAFDSGSQSFDWLHKRADGTVFPAEVLLSRVDLRGGSILQATVRDVTERVTAQEELQRHQTHLEEMVQQRVRELKDTNARLQVALSEGLRMEHLLRQSEERFRSLVETTSDWIWETDANGFYTYASPKVKEILGYDPEEIVCKTPFDFMPPDEADRVTRIFAQAVQNAQPLVRIENTNVHMDGRRIVLETSGVPIMDSTGHMVGYRGVGRDITEQKKAEDALRQSEQRFRAIADYTYDWENWVGTDGRLLWVNPSVQRMTGYTPEEVMTMKDFPMPLIAEEDRQRIRESFESSVRGRPTEAPLEFRILRKDGGGVWGSVVAQAIFDDQGRWLGHRSSIRDITERKRAEEALRASEERWKAIVASEPECVKVLDREGRVMEMNPAGLEMVQASIEQVRGQRVSGLLAEESQAEFEEMVAAVFRGETRRLVFDVIGLQGRQLTLETVSVPLWDPVEKGRVKYLIGVTRNITERKRFEDALRESEYRYAMAQRAAHIGSWDWNILTGEIYWSDQIEPMFGFAPGQFVRTYEAFLQCVHPDDRDMIVRAVNAAVKDRQEYAIEHRIVWPDGTVRWVAETGEVHRDANGKAVRMFGIVRDVTDRKRAEEELKKRLEELLAWENVTLGREERVMELKKEVNDLLVERGQPPRYGGTIHEPPHLSAEDKAPR